MRYLSALLLPAVLLVTACGSDDDKGVRARDVHYASEDDRVALQDAVASTVVALEAVYGKDVDYVFDQITLVQTTSAGVDPSGVAPQDSKGYRLPIEKVSCAGNGPTAHAIAHIASLVMQRDADAAHLNKKLFAQACGTDTACVAATVEESTRDLCSDSPRGGDDTGGSSPTPGR